jgi:hypothetical protein
LLASHPTQYIRVPSPQPYYWYHRPEFPPSPIRHTAAYDGAARLCLACTQTELSPREQRELVREWCALLPTLNSVRTLWLVSQVPQTLFDAACQMPALEGLFVKWSRIVTLDALGESRKLKYLHLGNSTRVGSLDPIGACPQLQWLDLQNIKLVPRLDAIAELTGLEGLTLEGAIDTTWHIDSVAPLAGMTNLRYLSLVNTRARDPSFAKLSGLRRLERLIVPQWWDRIEVERLRAWNLQLAS